jgi:hypothetical protein
LAKGGSERQCEQATDKADGLFHMFAGLLIVSLPETRQPRQNPSLKPQFNFNGQQFPKSAGLAF